MDMPKMIDLQQLTHVPVSTGAAITTTTLKAIYTATTSGLATTASISVGSATQQDLQQLFQSLGETGLTVTNSGSTFTVGWGTN